MTARRDSNVPATLGKIKLKYLVLFIMGLLAWSGLYAPEAIGLLLTVNLIFLFLLNLARFKYLPKAQNARNLSLVESVPKDPVKVRAILICDQEPCSRALKTLKSLRHQSYPELETLILRVGKYDKTYERIKSFCEENPESFKVFRKEGPLNKGEAMAICLEHGNQDYEHALLISPGLKLAPHILNQAINSITRKQADYLQFFSQNKQESIFEKKRVGFFRTYMRAAPSCASPGVLAPMALLKRKSIPEPSFWKDEKSPFLALSISLIKNGKRGFFEPSACGSGLGEPTVDLKRTIYEVKLGDALQIGAPRFMPLMLQLTSQFHFIAAPALFFALCSLEMFFGLDLLPKNDHSAFLAGSAVLLSLYFKLALIYQKHCEDLPISAIIKNYFIDLGEVLFGKGALKGLATSALLLAFIVSGVFHFKTTQNINFLAPLAAGLLVLLGSYAFFREGDLMLKRRRKEKRKSFKKSGKNKGVWGIEMNSSEA